MKAVVGSNRAVAAIAASCLLFATAVRGSSDDFSLSAETLAITNDAARLSGLSYTRDGELDNLEASQREEIAGATAFLTSLTHPDFADFNEMTVYTQEPDQALLAKKGERCFLAFRGTVGTSMMDWLQNLDPSDRVVNRNNDTKQAACEVRKGYVEFLDAIVVHRVFADIVTCMDSITCEDDPCLVITGHSQGGASATIASILLYDFEPTVVTFGQPPAVDTGCDSIPSERFYRYVNSMKETDEDDEMAFDPVPFVPTPLSQSVHYGHGILLGEDSGSVKYLGIDEDADFVPSVFDRRNEDDAHSIGKDTEYGYDGRVKALLSNSANLSISTDGFSDGLFCDRDYHDLCASGWCSFDNQCSPRSSETCVPDSCEKDKDCASGACIRDSCAPAKGMVEGGCPCYLNRDCASEECDMKITNLGGWTCVYGPDEEVREQSGANASFSCVFLCAAAIVSILLSLPVF